MTTTTVTVHDGGTTTRLPASRVDQHIDLGVITPIDGRPGHYRLSPAACDRVMAERIATVNEIRKRRNAKARRRRNARPGRFTPGSVSPEFTAAATDGRISWDACGAPYLNDQEGT